MRRVSYLVSCIIAMFGLGFGLSCIAPVSLDNTPCPCVEGYTCCLTLGRCLSVTQVCPSQMPSSSQKECSRDEECPLTESCHSWTIQAQGAAEAEIQGPRQCRRKCGTGVTCADHEYCQLAPSGAVSLQLLELKPLCLAQDLAQQCPGWSCQDCLPEEVGRTFCKGTELHGCLISVHPVCGLTCRKTKMADCMSCVEKAAGTQCQIPGTGDIPLTLCPNYPCSGCTAGTTFCNDRTLRTCLHAPYADPKCNELCLPIDLATCESGCVSSQDGHSASCRPK